MQALRIVIIIVLIVFILTAGLFTVNYFFWGKVKDVRSIGVADLLVTKEVVSFTPVFASSADYMGRYAYRITNDILYVKMESVYFGRFGRAFIEIKNDFSQLQKIILEDGEREKTIWEKP